MELYKIIGATIVISMLGFSGCAMHENYLIKSMVEHGTNPMAASCAIAPHMQQEAICGMAATK